MRSSSTEFLSAMKAIEWISQVYKSRDANHRKPASFPLQKPCTVRLDRDRFSSDTHAILSEQPRERVNGKSRHVRIRFTSQPNDRSELARNLHHRDCHWLCSKSVGANSFGSRYSPRGDKMSAKVRGNCVRNGNARNIRRRKKRGTRSRIDQWIIPRHRPRQIRSLGSSIGR